MLNAGLEVDCVDVRVLATCWYIVGADVPVEVSRIGLGSKMSGKGWSHRKAGLSELSLTFPDLAIDNASGSKATDESLTFTLSEEILVFFGDALSFALLDTGVVAVE